MKKIFFLLLFTIASYGQAVFDEGIQLTNTESTTATKVNVQEANGKVNTQTINTGFNKNIGLGGSDVVGANTLLNQYSTTPVDWTATTFNSGQVVFHGGKQWISNVETVAGDVPSVSSKWGEITFEALDASDSQIEISANSNTLDAWNKKTILFTANCTITVPSTLLPQFGFVFRTLAGVTVTWAITSPFTWETTPTTTPEKTTGSFMRRGSTNTILLDF